MGVSVRHEPASLSMSLIALNIRMPGLCREAAVVCRSLYAQWRDPYRPELHYMRGPGPKWRERHVIVVGSMQAPRQG